MKTKRKVVLVALFTCAAVGAFAADSITGVSFGTGGPLGVLGSFTMTSTFSASGVEGDTVDAFSFSGGRIVSLSPSLTLNNVGSGWNTWSNSYSGKVFGREVDIMGAGVESILLTLPTNTLAFSLYVEPNFYGPFTFDITATNAGGSLSYLAMPITGDSGAAGFGFYTNNLLQPLTTVSVTIGGDNAWESGGFAIGQFGIDGPSTNAPDGGSTVVLLGLAALALVWTRRAVAR